MSTVTFLPEWLLLAFHARQSPVMRRMQPHFSLTVCSRCSSRAMANVYFRIGVARPEQCERPPAIDGRIRAAG